MNLTVGKLKRLLEDVNDNVVVLTPSRDHGYRHVSAEVNLVVKTDREYSEYHGDEWLNYGDEVVKALLIE